MNDKFMLGLTAFCSNCEFWQIEQSIKPLNEGKTIGRCRAYPPVPKHWPITKNSDWCGNWHSKPNISVKSRGDSVLIPIGTTLEEVQQILITETLRQCNDDKEKAAQILGISTRTLYRRETEKKNEP